MNDDRAEKARKLDLEVQNIQELIAIVERELSILTGIRAEARRK